MWTASLHESSSRERLFRELAQAESMGSTIRIQHQKKYTANNDRVCFHVYLLARHAMDDTTFARNLRGYTHLATTDAYTAVHAPLTGMGFRGLARVPFPALREAGSGIRQSVLGFRNVTDYRFQLAGNHRRRTLQEPLDWRA